MKKVALLLATLMVISLLPMATFAADVTSADGLTITAIDNGASTDATAPLTDSITYSLGVGMLMYNQDSNYWYNAAKAASYVYAFANNTNDKILEFNWTGGKAIRRLDLWVGADASFSTYEIQIKDGGNWVKHAEGTMVYGAGGSRQCDYHALLFDPIPETSTALRVVMKGVNGQLYIGEARISEDNNYNLIAYGMNADDFEAGRMNGYNKNSSYTNGSKYYSGVIATNAYFSGITNASYHLNNESMCRYFAVIWPCALNSASKQYLIPNENGSLYYAVNFAGRFSNAHKIKVNRVKVNMNAGTAEGFDVYVDNASGMDNLKSTGTATTGYLDANVNDWTKVASYEGLVKGTDWTVLDIPNSSYGGQWMVVFNNPSEGAQVANIEMYQMAEDELGLGGEDEEEEIELPDEYVLAIDNGTKTIVTEPLSDGITYSLGVGMLMYNQDGNYWYSGTQAANYVHKFTKDGTNKTLEFKWVGGKAMRRLDLWVSEGAPFSSYEIQIKDGDEWVKHAEGTMAYGTGGSRQCDYHALLFDPIPADSETLRVVMKGVNASADLYIGEARLSDNNDYNLIAYGMNEQHFDAGIMNAYNKQWDNYKAARKYSGVVATNALFSGVSGQSPSGSMNTNVESTCRYHSVIWPTLLNNDAKQYLTPNANGSMYYAVNFSGRNPNCHTVEVNRIKVNMNIGYTEGFDVYVDNGSGMANLYAIASAYGDANTSEWTKVASYDGRVSGLDWAVLDIPNTLSGGQWMVVFKNPSENAQVANIQMYQMAEDELAGGTTLTGEVAPGKAVTLKGSYNTATAKTTTVMFGLYEGDKLVRIANGGSFALTGKGQYATSYYIPSEGVAAEGLTVKAFLWNSLDALQPLQAPITLAQ